jgi:hypothetical protein
MHLSDSRQARRASARQGNARRVKGDQRRKWQRRLGEVTVYQKCVYEGVAHDTLPTEKKLQTAEYTSAIS